jgi:hypothetical protein
MLLRTAGPNTLELAATVAVASEHMKSGAMFCLGAGARSHSRSTTVLLTSKYYRLWMLREF